jgi:DNA (cytosine-5)-methyltransferase 1
MTHLELFAGIGGFRRAIDLFCMDNNKTAECVGFSEIDSNAVKSYKAIHDTNGEVEIGDIQKFVKEGDGVNKLPKFNLLTGGFPCQAFSMMGKKRGFQDERGEVYYRIIDILVQKEPKFILLENVRNLKSHDGGKTYMEVMRALSEDANYEADSVVLDTKDFGLPQTRRRIFIFGIHRNYLEDGQTVRLNEEEIIGVSWNHDHVSSLNCYASVLDGLLSSKVDSKYYLSDKIKPTILANGSKKFESKSEINQLVARPLTASMVKMHRACQDNYYSDPFLNAKDPKEYLKQSFSKEELASHAIRKITPEEAFKLQGFNLKDVQTAKEAGVSDHQLYRQAGNAVSVNAVYCLLKYLNQKYALLDD